MCNVTGTIRYLEYVNLSHSIIIVLNSGRNESSSRVGTKFLVWIVVKQKLHNFFNDIPKLGIFIRKFSYLFTNHYLPAFSGQVKEVGSLSLGEKHTLG